MRSVLVLFILAFSSQVFAMSWNDIEEGQTYTLTQELKLVSNSPGRAALHIPAGTVLTKTEVLPLDMIMVMLYKFNFSGCPEKDFETEMEIIPVVGTSPVVELGAQVAGNCVLEVFIETKDIYTNSILK